MNTGGCRQNPAGCIIAIQHRTFQSTAEFASYNAWSDGDNFLDWSGFELGQGEYRPAPKSQAEGSPAVLISADVTAANYLSYNT